MNKDQLIEWYIKEIKELNMKIDILQRELTLLKIKRNSNDNNK